MFEEDAGHGDHTHCACALGRQCGSWTAPPANKGNQCQNKISIAHNCFLVFFQLPTNSRNTVSFVLAFVFPLPIRESGCDSSFGVSKVDAGLPRKERIEQRRREREINYTGNDLPRTKFLACLQNEEGNFEETLTCKSKRKRVTIAEQSLQRHESIIARPFSRQNKSLPMLK